MVVVIVIMNKMITIAMTLKNVTLLVCDNRNINFSNLSFDPHRTSTPVLRKVNVYVFPLDGRTGRPVFKIV